MLHLYAEMETYRLKGMRIYIFRRRDWYTGLNPLEDRER